VRSVLGAVLVGLGVFTLAAAALTRFYIAPQMIVAPTDYYKVTRLQAANASYFDQASLQPRTGATITVTSTVRGDIEAAKKAPGNTAVWDTSTVIQDMNNNYNINITKQRLAFDRRTADLARCCGAHVDDDRNVAMSGVGLFWPLQVERKNYEVWDSSTKRAWTAQFTGTEKVSGIEAYKFVMTVPPTKVPSATTQVPAKLLGLPGDAQVPVDRMHQATVTYWIDPRSGSPLDQRQQVRVTVRPQSGGPGELVAMDMDLRPTPESKAAFLDGANETATKIRAIELLIPVGFLVLGLVLTVVGGVMAAGGRKPKHRRQDGIPVPTPEPASAS
jgi:hypothetical protein